ncbi:MAG: hypothetical protein SynsKO_43340 [Synoicihabitans sp.]
MSAPKFAKMIFGAVGLVFGSMIPLSAAVVESDLSGLAQATSGLVGLTSPAGDLVRSVDAGASFTTTRSATATGLVNLAASGDTVAAVGDAGYIVRSSDGGATWADASSPTFTGELNDVAANGTTWVAVGSANSNIVVLLSTDDGATWSTSSVPSQTGALNGVTYDASSNRWTAVGTDGIFSARIITSTNGTSWTSVTVPVGADPLTDVAADGSGNVLAVGEAGTLVVSADGGATFALDANSGLVSENLNVVVFSPTSGWTAGGVDLVQVSYSTGGGATLTQAPVPGAGDITALAVDASGEVLTAGQLSGFQSITFDAIADQPLSSGSITLAATASSGLDIAFALVSGPATLDGTTLTLTGAGTVVVRASQNGNESFGPAAPVERSFEVTLGSATVTLGDLAATYDGSPKVATATTDPSGLTVNITYDGSSTAPTDAGSYEVVGTISDTSFSGSATDTLVIAKADQTITFAAPADRDLADGSFELTASSSAGLPVSFSVDSGPASLNGNTLTMSDVGTVTLTASQAGNNNYNAAESVTQSFDVSVATPEITLEGLIATFDGTPKVVTATTLPPGLTVNITYDGSATAPSAVGSYAVNAVIDDTTYSGSTSGTLVISKGPQTIDFPQPADVPFTSNEVTLTATASSGLDVAFAVVSGPATVVGNSLTLTGSGDVTVRASQAGDDAFVAAESIDRTFTVTPTFASWRIDNFTPAELADANVSGANAVYGADGISNLLKYAFGLAIGTDSVLPTDISVQEGVVVFTFDHPASVTDVTFSVEVSTDLENWSADGVVLESLGTTEGRTQWKATAPGVAPRVFFRVKASR